MQSHGPRMQPACRLHICELDVNAPGGHARVTWHVFNVQAHARQCRNPLCSLKSTCMDTSVVAGGCMHCGVPCWLPGRAKQKVVDKARNANHNGRASWDSRHANSQLHVYLQVPGFGGVPPTPSKTNQSCRKKGLFIGFPRFGLFRWPQLHALVVCAWGSLRGVRNLVFVHIVACRRAPGVHRACNEALLLKGIQCVRHNIFRQKRPSR